MAALDARTTDTRADRVAPEHPHRIRSHLRYLYGLWRRFLARYRLDPRAVCEESVGKGLSDYHDYPDDEMDTPVHFVTFKCKRCGKLFTI